MATNVKGTLKYRKAKRNGQFCKGYYFPTAVVDRTIDFEEFVTHIADHTSPFSRGTVHGVMTDMLSCLQELVLDGKSVRLGDLGLFSIGFRSTGSEVKEECTAAKIKSVHLIVRNTKSWSNTELVKKCKIEEYNTYEEKEGAETV